MEADDNNNWTVIFVIWIDTEIEVIVVSPTTWEANHSPRAQPEGAARGRSPRAQPEGAARGRSPRAQPEGAARGRSPRAQPEGAARGRSPRAQPEGAARGRSPRAQPEGAARGLWWASRVVGDTTVTEIEVSISILSWYLKAY